VGPGYSSGRLLNLIQNRIQIDLNYSNFDRLKNGLPDLKKIE
jgi:hypothetical protein